MMRVSRAVRMSPSGMVHRAIDTLAENLQVKYARAKAVWRQADAVCFDVDCTLIKEISLLELAKFVGRGTEVFDEENKTFKIMPIREAVLTCLNIIQPTVDQITTFNEKKSLTLCPWVEDLIRILHGKNVSIYLVTNGIKCLVEPLAEMLHVSPHRVFANEVTFFFDGTFAGLSSNSTVLNENGKYIVAANLKRQYKYKNLVFIGDGPSDLQTSPPADTFIGYGGVIIRNIVKEKSKWYILNYKELITELP